MSSPQVNLDVVFNDVAEVIARVVADIKIVSSDECRSKILDPECSWSRLNKFLQSAQGPGYDPIILDDLARDLENCAEEVRPLGCCMYNCDSSPRATISINTNEVWKLVNNIYNSYQNPNKSKVNVQDLYVELLKLIIAHEYAHCLMAAHRCVLGPKHSVYSNLPWVFSHVIEESLATAFEYVVFEKLVIDPVIKEIIEDKYFKDLPPGYSGFREWFGIPAISIASMGLLGPIITTMNLGTRLQVNEDCFIWGIARVLMIVPSVLYVFEKPPLNLPPLYKELMDISNTLTKTRTKTSQSSAQRQVEVVAPEELYNKYGGDILWRLVALRILKSGGPVGVKGLSR